MYPSSVVCHCRLTPDPSLICIGNFDYTGLHLKKSVLERFGLPVEIVAGDIGKLSIKIPWGAMKDSPCRVEIDDVYILARAKPQGKVNPEEDERMEQAGKQDRLRSAEAVDNAATQVGTKGQTDEGEFWIKALSLTR
jgi:vacuolar protein sorting-associated protein 13A/C